MRADRNPCRRAVPCLLGFLDCAFAHFAFTQGERNRAARDEMNLVRRQTREIAEDLLSTQTKALQLRQSLEQVGRAGDVRVY